MTIKADTIAEQTERFTVGIRTVPNGATIADGTQSWYIGDDD